MPLTKGIDYVVHVSTYPPGTSPPNAKNNPGVTGHSVHFTY
ncbi:hypothetical protein AB0442_29670 [Kitasatospora sp. NPDC085895]